MSSSKWVGQEPEPSKHAYINKDSLANGGRGVKIGSELENRNEYINSPIGKQMGITGTGMDPAIGGAGIAGIPKGGNMPQGMMNGQGFQGQGYGQTQGLMGMPQTDVGMLINNLSSGSGGSGNLDQFMSAAFQQPGTQQAMPQQAMPQQPVDTGSVGYMNQQQQNTINQGTNFGSALDFSNQFKSQAPPTETANEVDAKIVTYVGGDGDMVRTTYGELNPSDKQMYDIYGYVPYS